MGHPAVCLRSGTGRADETVQGWGMQGIGGDQSAAAVVFSWPYLLVPLMMTRCAGRFTPRASVEVVHSTYGGRGTSFR